MHNDRSKRNRPHKQTSLNRLRSNSVHDSQLPSWIRHLNSFDHWHIWSCARTLLRRPRTISSRFKISGFFDVKRWETAIAQRSVREDAAAATWQDERSTPPKSQEDRFWVTPATADRGNMLENGCLMDAFRLLFSGRNDDIWRKCQVLNLQYGMMQMLSS